MALPPVPYQTDFQDQKAGRITQPWLQWLEQLRNTLNRLAEGRGTTLHEALTDVTSDQHHAEIHTHVLSFGAVTDLTDYNLTTDDGSSTTLSRSDHSHGSVMSRRNLWAIKQWYAARFVNAGVDVTSVASASLVSEIGCSLVIVTASTVNVFQVWDAINPYGALLTSAVLDNAALCYVHMGAATGSGSWIAPHNPYSQFGIKTGSSIANITIFIGATVDPSSTTPSNLQENLPNGVSWPNFIGFRFLASGGTGTWDVIHRLTTAAATITSTGVAVTADTSYKFEIETVDYGVTWTFNINDVLVHTATTNLPNTDLSVAPSMQEIVWIRNKVGGAGSAKSIKLRSFYTEYGGDISQTS